MDIQVTTDTANRAATLRLSGACATEHAAALAAAWRDLLGRVDAAGGQGKPRSRPRPGGWEAFLDISAVTAVGLAFFEVTAAAALALGRRGVALSRQGTLPEPVGQAARIAGFARAPGLTGLFASPDGFAASERR